MVYRDTVKYQTESGGQLTENVFNHFVWDWSYKFRIEKLSGDSLSAIKDMKDLEPEDKGLILDLMREMQIIGWIEDGKNLMEIAGSDQKFDYNPLDMIEELSKQYAKNCGFTETVMAFGNCQKDFKARILSEPKMQGIPSHILSIADDLKRRCAHREIEAQDAMREIWPAKIHSLRLE